MFGDGVSFGKNGMPENIYFTRTLSDRPPVIDYRALTLRKERRMKNTTEMTCAEEWVEAICQILADARDLWGFAVREQDSSCGQEQSPGPDPYSTAGNGQMLLPGIADPHRWNY